MTFLLIWFVTNNRIDTYIIAWGSMNNASSCATFRPSEKIVKTLVYGFACDAANCVALFWFRISDNKWKFCGWKETKSIIPHPSVFQPGFREWLPGVPQKQTEGAWDEISNHSSMRLCSNPTVSQHPCHYESYWKLCLSIGLAYCSLCVEKPYAIGFHELRNICGGSRCSKKVANHCSTLSHKEKR